MKDPRAVHPTILPVDTVQQETDGKSLRALLAGFLALVFQLAPFRRRSFLDIGAAIMRRVHHFMLVTLGLLSLSLVLLRCL